MGRYEQDPRVLRDSPDQYRLPDEQTSDDWHVRRVRRDGAGWQAHSVQGQVSMDPTDRYHHRRQRFLAADEAIARIIGDPVDHDDR